MKDVRVCVLPVLRIFPHHTVRHLVRAGDRELGVEEHADDVVKIRRAQIPNGTELA